MGLLLDLERGWRPDRCVHDADRTLRRLVASLPVTVGVRPEGWLIVGEGEQLPVSVNMIEALGSDGFIYGSCGLGGTLSSS